MRGLPFKRAILKRQLVFSISVTIVLSWFSPIFLLLNDAPRAEATRTLLLVGVFATLVGGGWTWRKLDELRATVEALSRRKRSDRHVNPNQVHALSRGPGKFSRRWMIPHWVGLSIFVTPFRPRLMDFSTGITLAMLGALIVAAASLPLHASLRSVFLKLIESVPSKVTLEVLNQHASEARWRITQRLVASVATPIVFVSIGCALIANAHIRRADERLREATARKLAKAAFQVGPDVNLGAAVERARDWGFDTKLSPFEQDYSVSFTDDGKLDIATPVDGGSANMSFSGSTVSVLSPAPLLLALLAVISATLLGLALGSSLGIDLMRSTRRVRTLGTEVVLGGSVLIERKARFRLVSDLESGIERVAARFRTFAEAQQSAIEAREAAIRMRGLFFASVSHDLRSPLNAILGFTELVRSEPLNAAQRENLDVVQRRGRELLALIETILDAARVEAHQLSLMMHEESYLNLFEAALERAEGLCGDNPMRIYDDIQHDLPPVIVDSARMARAIATFIAYSVRATKGSKMWVRAEMETEKELRIDVDVPTTLHSAEQLTNMLAPSGTKGEPEYRGMALALRLARNLVELHRGRVRVVDRGAKGTMFCIFLPTARPGRLRTEDEMRTARTTGLHASSRPPPARPSSLPPANRLSRPGPLPLPSTPPLPDAAPSAPPPVDGSAAADASQAVPSDAIPTVRQGTTSEAPPDISPAAPAPMPRSRPRGDAGSEGEA